MASQSFGTKWMGRIVPEAPTAPAVTQLAPKARDRVNVELEPGFAAARADMVALLAAARATLLEKGQQELAAECLALEQAVESGLALPIRSKLLMRALRRQRRASVSPEEIEARREARARRRAALTLPHAD